MIFTGGAIAITQPSTARRLGWLKRFAVILGRFAFPSLFVPVLSLVGFMRYQATLLFKL